MSVHSLNAKIHLFTQLDVHSQSWWLATDWSPININIFLYNSLHCNSHIVVTHLRKMPKITDSKYNHMAFQLLSNYPSYLRSVCLRLCTKARSSLETPAFFAINMCKLASSNTSMFLAKVKVTLANTKPHKSTLVLLQQTHILLYYPSIWDINNPWLL